MTHTRKPRHPKKRIEGEFPIDTGTARIIADPHRDGSYVLEINDVPSSQVILGAPRVLVFPYMHWIAAAIEPVITKRPLAHIVHLGGAGCALPSYCVDKWHATRNTVVEIDGKLGELVRWAFSLSDDLLIDINEARNATHALEPGDVDVLIRDVFAGPSTPRHVTTVGFFQAVKRALAPGGLYIANCGDREGLPGAREELAGMLKVFDYVGAIGPAEMLGGRAYGNIILWGSDTPLDYIGAESHRDCDWAREITAGVAPRRD
ncbi:fused MFS/spermidine synthase [Corynebacterium breve]|uniref:Fused MFS/spermidine synthase n=1 Tax=Corynebacterium breve TaxID=3049799 RepID=A0ABY8VHH3_9CORY|nr:fused MFS/spermidine synthase [Corynebacterium breve]WIM68527.1 fused MFS/spermidine synthase [Corynebacterium breve]